MRHIAFYLAILMLLPVLIGLAAFGFIARHLFGWDNSCKPLLLTPEDLRNKTTS